MRQLTLPGGAARLALICTLAGLSFASAQTPVITAQPQSQSKVLGYPATLSVSATPASPPLSYQWRKESVPIPGATGSAFGLGSVKYTDAGTYSVIVSNVNGTTLSAPATLIVTPPIAGEVDFAFNPGSGANALVRSVAVQANSKVLVGGDFTTVNGTNRNRIARLNADGSLDTTFLNGLTGANNQIRAVTVQPDGKVLIGGFFTTVNNVGRTNIARLNADGSLDLTFQTSMTMGSGLSALVNSVAVQADGKVLIGGQFNTVNGVSRNYSARLNVNGTLDATFQNGMAGANAAIFSMAIQADGKILIGGYFTTVNATNRYRIARLNADGSLDSTFQNNMTGVGGELYAVAVQADGKVLVGGSFNTINGTARRLLARLDASGNLDPTFQDIFQTGNGAVYSVVVQADSRVVIGGGFSGAGRNSIARLNADGSLDTTFQNGLIGPDNSVNSVVVQPDGKMMIVGEFNAVNGVNRNFIARLLGTAEIYDATDADGDGLSNGFERQFGMNTEIPDRQVGTGAAGPLTVTDNHYTDDVWAQVLGNNPAGSANLKVSRTNGFASNDLVMMITMQDPNPNLAQNTAGNYEFGRIATLSSNALTLTQPRNKAFTVTGSALKFDGLNDYVELYPSVSGGDFTIEFWFRSTQVAGSEANWYWGQGLVDGEVSGVVNDFGLSFGNGKVLFGTGNPDITIRSTNALADGKWHHVAATREQFTGTMKLFVDGFQHATGTGSTAVLNAPTQMRLGSLATGIGYFNGELDEVRIWYVARSQAEITNNMLVPLTGREDGLAAYYRLDEGAGDIAQDSQMGGDFDGTLMNGPVWTEGSPVSPERIQLLKVPEYSDVSVAGAGLSFNRSLNQSLQVANFGNVIPTNEITIEFWQKVDTSVSSQATFRLNSTNGINFIQAHVPWINGTVYWDFGYDDASRRLSYTPAENIRGTWQHFAFVASQSGNYMRIFRNGVQEASKAGMAPFPAPSGDLWFGKTPAWSWGGELAEVRIWNVARSQTDITNNMRQTLTGAEPGLLAYYRFDEGAGNTAYDATANDLDGTLVNGPTWTVDSPLPANLTCRPWDGTSGGVLAFLAQNVTLGSSGVISADGKGYRGGLGVPSIVNWQPGITGEGTTGFSTARAANSFERPQGGGGAGKGGDGSGGGGGYGSPGLDGGFTDINGSDYGRGATSFSVNTLPRLYPGGGGGGSGSHSAGRVGVAGGAGGGIVFMAAGSIAGGGTISSRGAAGQAGVFASDANSGAGGGGGAGGSVYVLGNAGNSLQILASGGTGGPHHPSSPAIKDGGAGGVGRLRLDVPASGIVPTNISPALGWRAQIAANDPLTRAIWGPYFDSNFDGTNDWQQFNLWTLEDSDGDGVANVIESQHGSDPGNADSDGDGLSDYQELFVSHTNPLKADSDGDGTSDGAEVAAGRDPLSSDLLASGQRYQYDPLNRLVGVDYATGLSLLYTYDGNDNLLRQAYLSREAGTNGPFSSASGLFSDVDGQFTDSDGDGYTDGQEWWAGSAPGNANSTPADPLGPSGSNITAEIVFPFIPSNCVVAVGQLDGIGAEEIVVSADGNPGTTTNFLIILSQTPAGWSTQRVDIGPFGVTSLAVGQPANRPTPAIYAGLRESGGNGRIIEFTPSGGSWISNTVVTSLNDAAFVLGVRAGKDVLASLQRPGPPAGSSYYLTFATNVWTALWASPTASTKGLGTITASGMDGVARRGVRVLDAGGLQVLGHDVTIYVPTNAVWNEDYSRWFFRTPNALTWANAQSLASITYLGNLATVTDATLDAWLWNQFGGSGTNFWIGLFRSSTTAPWQWASGAPFTYPNWAPGQPTGSNNKVYKWDAYAGKWYNSTDAVTWTGIIEVSAVERPSVLAPEPATSQRLIWKGHSLTTGNLRLTNALSVLYTFVDDKNLNNLMDANDDLVVAEYLYDGTNLTALGTQIAPMSGSALAQSYGLASLEVLYGNQQVLFTAEPDGRIFSWSATNSTAPLQRQLFSAHDQGKAWHALAGVRTLDPAQSLLGLRVDPGAPNRCDVVLWPPRRDLSAPAANYPLTAPLTQILPAPNGGTNLASVDIRCWDAEANQAQLKLQYQLPLSSAWVNATINPDQSVTTHPTGRTHRVYWDALHDLGSGFTNVVNLRAQAQDVSLAGDWSAAVAYEVRTFVGNNPQAFNDSAFTSMNQAVDIDVLGNDTVLNSAPKLIANVELPLYGSAAINGNQTVHYTPPAGFVGTDGFGYLLSDGDGGLDWAWVTVTVTDAPFAPIVIESPIMQAGNQFSMLISGPPGQVYQVQVSTNLTDWSAVGTLTNVTGTVPFTEQPATNASRFYRAQLLP